VAAAPASRAPEPPPAPAPAAAPSSPASSSAAGGGAGAPSAQAELGAGSTAGDTYGPIEKGETLSKIAGQVKPSDVSLEQMLVALYRQNQAAFSGNNMNRLKTGQILKVPTSEEVAQVAPAEAGKEIRTHVADWKAYREQLAAGAASIPSRADTSNTASGRVASAAVTPPAPPTAEPKDSLKLSKSDAAPKGAAGKAGGGGGGTERVNALQEEVIAKDKALRDSQSRVADLEKQIRDMQRLLDLKAGVAAKPADTKVATAPAPAPTPAPPPAKPAEPAKVTVAPEATKAPEVAKPADEPKPAEVTPAPPPVTEAAKPPPPKTDTAKPAAKKAAPPPKSFLDELLDNPAYLAIAGGGIIALALGAFLLARRRKARAEAEPNSSMTSAFPSDLKPNTNTGKPGGGLVDTGNSSFLTDFDKTGPGTIDTDEVDPVAEAEVYIAYGRDAQAEEILKEAMARDKNRHEIALKLLEIYHARKSATAFENVAKELRSAVGENHPLWQKAAAMGAQIDPSNPLYISAAAGTATFTAMSPAAAAPQPKPNLDFDLDTSPTTRTETSTSAPAPDFDLDLDAQRPSAAPDLPVETSSGLDFDLAPSPSKVDVPSDSHRPEKSSFDFDLSGLDMPSSKPSGGEPRSAAAGGGSNIDLADLSLDSPAAGGGEGVGTKLELAKAYLEIGDKDGARDILQEVAKEGSAAQKEEAKKLIASL
jgi:pilus assembly protein FimV